MPGRGCFTRHGRIPQQGHDLPSSKSQLSSLRNGNTFGRVSLGEFWIEGLGGAIDNAGTVLAEDCVFANNNAAGYILGVPGAGKGGAIFNSGSFAANRCTFHSNRAWGGNSSGVLGPGEAGLGGAIFNLSTCFLFALRTAPFSNWRAHSTLFFRNLFLSVPVRNTKGRAAPGKEEAPSIRDRLGPPANR